jgi:hypothetical protein
MKNDTITQEQFEEALKDLKAFFESETNKTLEILNDDRE